MSTKRQVFQRLLAILIIAALLLQQVSAAALAGPPSKSVNAPQLRSLSDVKPAPSRAATSNFFADLNGDKQVDANDLRQAAEGWNCAIGDNCFSADLDRDGNGVVDALDLAAIAVEFDSSPPQIAITSPAAGAVLGGGQVNVVGTVVDSHAIAQVTVNGIDATVNGDTFSASIPATNGNLLIQAAAVDALGLTTGDSVLVNVDASGPSITVQGPKDRQSVYTKRPAIALRYADLAGTVNPNSLNVTLTDEAGGVIDVTGFLSADSSEAGGTVGVDLQEDESYTLRATVQDNSGNSTTVTSSFYVPLNADGITPPAQNPDTGFVGGSIYDSATCGGEQAFDPIDCTGIPGATVTLERVDADALALARSARLNDLAAASARRARSGGPDLGLPAGASRAPVAFRAAVAGAVVSGPDGFYAFPADVTGSYAVRVEKNGYTYGQRIVEIVKGKSSTSSDIFLTPLDPAVTPCTEAGCQHTSSDGQMELDVPAGAIPGGETLDIRATEFDQVQYLPSGELPPGTGETYAFNLSGASEITFTTPITVKIKNDRGFGPGAEIPLGYWNQELQVWEHAGISTVDTTGEWLVMNVTHFSNFDPNAPVSANTASIEAEDETKKPGQNCAKDCDSSEIDLDTGALKQAFSLPTVQVLDDPLGVTLLYDSSRANPSAVIDIALSLQEFVPDAADGLQDVIQAELFIEGESTDQFSFRLDELEEDGEIGRFRFLWDGRNAQGERLPPGAYNYVVRVKLPFRAQFFGSTTGRFGGPPDPSRPLGVFTNSTIDRAVRGTVVIGSDGGGHFGAGWQMADVQRLFESENGTVVIDDGAHSLTEYFFPRSDLLNDTPRVLTLGRDRVHVPLSMQAPPAPTTPIFQGSQPSALSDAMSPVADMSPVAHRQISDPRSIATNVTDDISTDTTFVLADSPFNIENDITIRAGATLTVEAGVEIRVESGSTTSATIFIEGELLAQGTEGSKVTFTSDNDTTSRRWGGIVVQNGGSAELIHTDMRFGGRANVSGRDAGVAVISSTLVMSNTTMTTFGNFSNVPDGCLYVENSAVSLTDISFDDCGSPVSNTSGRNKVASVVLLGANTAVAADNVTVTNSHRFPLATDMALLDAIPAFTLDKSSVRLFGGRLERDATVGGVAGVDEFFFREDVSIAPSATLTVAPGLRWSASDTNTRILVEGTLVTQGTAAQPVVFTSDEDSEGGQWNGIFVDGGSADMSFTSIRFGGRLNVDGHTANLIVKNGDLHFVNSESLVAQDFGGGDSSHLALIDSTAFIDGALISDNGLNGANPDFGVQIVESGARVAGDVRIQNSTIVHRSAPLALPLASLSGISELNTFTTGANGKILIEKNDISGDVTLAPLGNLGTFELDGDVTVTGHLTLEPGTRLLSHGRFLRMDGGRLTAQGTQESPIVFASRTGNARAWDGLQLQNGGVADLRFVEIREAFRGIDINDGSLTLEYSKLLGNDAGIFLNGTVDEFFVHLNEFSGNTTIAIGNQTRPRVTLDARLNFWGDPSGPTHPTNPGGTGDRFTGEIIFEPFLGGADVDNTAAVNLTDHDVTQLAFDVANETFTRHYPNGSIVHFDSDGRQDFSRDSNGNEIRYTYNPDGSLATMGFVAPGRPSADWAWTFSYQSSVNSHQLSAASADRRLMTDILITDPAGRVTTLSVDQNGNLASLQEPGLDAPMTFAYGDTQNMTHKTDARGHTTTYEYDANGRVTRSLLPPREVFDPVTGAFSIAQEVHEFAPSGAGGQVVNDLDAQSPATPNDPLPLSSDFVSQQTVNGRTTQLQTNEFGAVIGSVDPLGNEFATERDERDNLTKMTLASGICIEFTYDGVDNITSETHLAADQCALPPDQRDPARVLRTVNTFEPRFNKTKTTTDPLGRTTTFVYDYEVSAGEAGNLAQVIYPEVENGESANRARVNPTEQYEYNGAGQVTRHVDLRGVATCFVYTTGDPGEAGSLFATGVTPVPGLLTQEIEDCGGSLERTFRYQNFNAAGIARTTIEYVGTGQERTTTYVLDARNRLQTETDPVGNVIEYRFDNGDNLVRNTVTGHDGQVITTEYDHNPLNDITRITDIGDDGTSRSLVFGYDLNRNETLSQDFNGNQERSVYDANDRLIRTIDAAGNKSILTYDADGRELTVTNPRGVTTRFEYDAFGRRSRRIQDDGGLNLVTQFAYDAMGNLTSFTDPLGTVTCFAYDAFDRETRMTEDCGGLNKTADTVYSLMGDPVHTTDALGRVKTIRYDALGRAIEMVDSLDNRATMAYDAADNLVTATDEVGQPLNMAYDVIGRLTSTTDALGETVSFTYDAFDSILSQTDQLGRTYTYEYDSFNRLSAVVDPLGNRSSYAYDDNDNVVRVTDPRGATANYSVNPFDLVVLTRYADGSTTAVEYDANLNKVREIDGFGNGVTYTYDAADRLVSRTGRDGAQMRYELDAVGNLLAEIDPLGNRTQQTLDGLYRVTRLDRANGESISYTYDLMGNLLTLTDGVGNTTSYTYDGMDRQLTETNALGQTRTSEYAPDGKLTRFVDRNGNDFTFTYDALRRLVQETETNSGATRSLSYDAAGQLVGAADANSQYAMTFDSRGNAAGIVGTYTTGAPTIGYVYTTDPAGYVVRRVEQIGGADTGTTLFSYDALGQMIRIEQQTAVNQRIDMAYDANGRMTRLDRSHNGSLAVSSAYAYAPDDYVTDIIHSANGSPVRSFTYDRDAHNRITAKTSKDGQSSYGYDSDDQLTNATHASQANEAYSYDANGNRTLAGHVTGADNRLTSAGTSSYEYDAEGNRTRRVDNSSGASVEYLWDHLNRLVGVVNKDGNGNTTGTVSYAYDVFNHRIRKTVNGVSEHYGYDGPNLTLVLDAAGAVSNRYLYGNAVDMVLADERADGVRWLLAEVNRSISDVLDGNGSLINHIAYDSFGNITSQTNPAEASRWGYTGREWDSESGLYQYRTRYYDAAIGRFISQDRLGFEGGDTNLYRYAANDAVNDTDPFGTLPGISKSVARGMRRAQEQALANNIKPTRKPIERGFFDSLVDFARDATIFLTDNAVTNSADQFFSGQANMLTFGATDALREKVYGEHATKNHTGGFRTAGEIAGFAQSFFLPGANAANVAKVRALLQAGDKGRAAILALGQALNVGQKVGFGVALDNAINEITNDPCLTEEEKARKLVELIGSLRTPGARTAGNKNQTANQGNKSAKKGQNKKSRSTLEKTRERNKQKAKENLRKKRESDQNFREAVKEHKYQKELKDYLRKRSMELRRKEAQKFLERKSKEVGKEARNQAKKTVDQEVKQGSLSKEAGEKLKKDIDKTGDQDFMDTDIRQEAQARGRIEREAKKRAQREREKQIDINPLNDNNGGGGGGFGDLTVPGLGG